MYHMTHPCVRHSYVSHDSPRLVDMRDMTHPYICVCAGLGWHNDAYYDTLERERYGGPSFQGANAVVSISATLLPVLLKMFKLQVRRE